MINYIDLVPQSGDLVLQPDLHPLDQHTLSYLRSLPHDTALAELLERFLCNGWVDLTGQLLFGGFVLQSPEDHIYYDNFYATKNAVEVLLKGQPYMFYRFYDT